MWKLIVNFRLHLLTPGSKRIEKQIKDTQEKSEKKKMEASLRHYLKHVQPMLRVH